MFVAVTDDLKNLVIKLEARVVSLEKGGVKAAPAAAPAAADDDDDDEVDLFGESDEEESEEKKRITEERLKAYHEKKAKKPALIAKTSVLLDIKPWDDETDMDKVRQWKPRFFLLGIGTSVRLWGQPQSSVIDTVVQREILVLATPIHGLN